MELLYANVPRVDSARRRHDSSGSFISDEHVGLAGLGNLLDVLIFDDGCLGPAALHGGKLLGSLDTALLPSHVEHVDLTGCDGITKRSRRQVEKFVEALLRELNDCGPLWLNLVGCLSETASLIVARLQGHLTCHVGALSLSLPLCSLSCNSWAHLTLLHV